MDAVGEASKLCNNLAAIAGNCRAECRTDDWVGRIVPPEEPPEIDFGLPNA